jgi:hypothetical protein
MELFLIALIAFEVLSGGFVTSAFAGAAVEGAKAAWGETSKGAKRWYGKRAKRMKKTRMGRWRLRTEATVAGGLAFVGRGVAAGAKAAPGGANKGRKARHAIRRKAVAKARAGGRQVLATGGAKVAEWRTRGGRGGGPDGAPSGANGGPVADPSEGDRDTAPVDDQPWWRRPGDPAPDPRVVVSDEVVHKDDPGVWRELEHYGRRESGNPPSRCPDCLGQGCADCDLGAIDGHVIDDLERRAWRDHDFMAAQDLVRIRRADPRLVPTAIEDPEAHANGWTRDEADRARLLQAMVDKAEEGGQEVPGLRADLEGLRMKGAAHRAAQDGERRDDGLTGHSDDAAERDLRRRAAAGDHEAKKLLMLAAVGAVKCGCCGMYHGRAMKPGEHCDWCRGHGHESQTTPPTGGGNDTTTNEGARVSEHSGASADNQGVIPYMEGWDGELNGMELVVAELQGRHDRLQASAEANAKFEIGGVQDVLGRYQHAIEAVQAAGEAHAAHAQALHTAWDNTAEGAAATGTEAGQELAGAR